MIDEGLNAGVTGILNLQGQSGVKFVGDVLGWNEALGVGVFDDAGRADGIWGNKIPLTAGGTLTLKGMTNLDGQPTPNDYRGERGPLVLQQTTGVTETVTVMVTNSTFTKSTKEDQLWDFVHVCSIVAAPAFAGWGGTNAAATQTFADKQLWSGLSKLVDPQGLQSAAGQRWRIWGIGDNDAAEKTKIDSVLAALSAPYATMKLRPSNFTRLSTNVCLIDVAWGVRNTKDDIEMPGTVTGNDLSDLEDSATITKVNTSSTPPTVPSAPIGQHVQTDTTQLDDTNWQHVFRYSNTNPQQRVEFDGTSHDVDPSALQDGDSVRVVNGSSTPPATPTPTNASLQLRQRISRRIGGTPEKWSHTFIFAWRTTQNEAEYEGSGVLDDPTDLEDGTEIALVQSSSTPSAPGTPSGLKLIGTATKELTPAKWLHTFRYGRRDNKDAIEQEGTYTDTDVSDLTSEGRQTTVYTTLSGVPADPSPPSGLQIVSSRITVRNNVKSIKTWIFAKDTTKQKAEQDASYIDVDPQGLDSKTAVAEVDATPSTPAGLVLRSTRTKSLTNDHDLNIVEAGERTTADDETFPKTRYVTDASAIEQEDSIAVVFVTGTTPTPPTRSGMVVADFYDAPITNAVASNLSVRVYRMSYSTNSQKLTLPRFNNAVDPNDLDTVKRSAVLFDTGSPPGDPGLPSGLKLFSKTDIGIASHPTKQVRIYQWEKNDSFDKITHGDTVSRTRSFEGTTADTASLLASTNTAALIATGIFNTYKASVTWEGATVKKLHDGLAEIILHTRDEEIIVAGRSSSARRVIAPAYLDGADVWVFMRRKIKIGSNLWEYELAEQYIWGEKIEFTIRRYVSGSTLPYHSDLLNTTNAATFLGLAAGFVTYLGVAESLTNIAVAANRVSSMTWCFEYDSLGIIDLADASPGWNWTTDDLTSVGPGWVKASDLGLSSSALGTGDYSVFIS